MFTITFATIRPAWAALITPWNTPMMLTTWKIGPALAAGNTRVVKPPERAPLTCSMLADLADEAGVPAGVVKVVQGIGEEAGAALVAHPDVRSHQFHRFDGCRPPDRTVGGEIDYVSEL